VSREGHLAVLSRRGVVATSDPRLSLRLSQRAGKTGPPVANSLDLGSGRQYRICEDNRRSPSAGLEREGEQQDEDLGPGPE